MIVDDQATNLRIMKQLALASFPGAQVVTFGNPVQALDHARKNPPDLIVSDYEMPDLDGAAFVTAIRQSEGCDAIPVIIVTIYEDIKLRYNALEAGATDFLISPIDHKEFSIRVHNLLLLQQYQRTIRNHARSLETKLTEDNQTFTNSLRELEQRVTQLIDAVPALISVGDKEQRLLYVNREWSAFHGLAKEDVIGKTPQDLFNVDHSALLRRADDTVLSSGAAVDHIEEEVLGGPRGRAVLLTKKIPLNDAVGEIAGVITVSLDITSRKLAEEQLATAMWRAEASERTKDAFFAQMSHELRTPLNAILGFSQIMVDGLFGPIRPLRYRNYAQDINASADRLLTMVNDILALDTMVEAPQGIGVDIVELRALASQAAQLVRERRGLTTRILCDIDSGSPHIQGDQRMIETILVDLLDHLVTLSGVNSEFVISVQLSPGQGARVEILGGQSLSIRPAAVTSILPSLPLVEALVTLHGGSLVMRRNGDGSVFAAIEFPAWRTSTPYGATTGG